MVLLPAAGLPFSTWHLWAGSCDCPVTSHTRGVGSNSAGVVMLSRRVWLHGLAVCRPLGPGRTHGKCGGMRERCGWHAFWGVRVRGELDMRGSSRGDCSAAAVERVSEVPAVH